jgi:hypothetical protein
LLHIERCRGMVGRAEAPIGLEDLIIAEPGRPSRAVPIGSRLQLLTCPALISLGFQAVVRFLPTIASDDAMVQAVAGEGRVRVVGLEDSRMAV